MLNISILCVGGGKKIMREIFAHIKKKVVTL